MYCITKKSDAGTKLTLVQTTLNLLPNSHQLHAGPEIRPTDLRHAESPAATIHVPTILPHGLEALLEKVDGFAHLDLVDWCIVVVAPEVLHGFDLCADLFERGRVGAICSGFGGGFLLLAVEGERWVVRLVFVLVVGRGG